MKILRRLCGRFFLFFWDSSLRLGLLFNCLLDRWYVPIRGWCLSLDDDNVKCAEVSQ
jgi:hypothetical protein